jgi:succinate-acetate transporter protein
VRIALISQTCVGMSHSNNNTGFLSNKVSIFKLGGYIGIVTAALAYYCGLSDLLTPNDIITLPLGKHDTQ